MAFTKKAKTESENANTSAVVSIRGVLTDVYDGKNRNYATVKVMRGEYYDNFTVSFEKDVLLPSSETDVVVNAKLTTFYDKTLRKTLVNIIGVSIVF